MEIISSFFLFLFISRHNLAVVRMAPEEDRQQHHVKKADSIQFRKIKVTAAVCCRRPCLSPSRLDIVFHLTSEFHPIPLCCSLSGSCSRRTLIIHVDTWSSPRILTLLHNRKYCATNEYGGNDTI